MKGPWVAPFACALITIAIFTTFYYVNGGALFPTDDAFINLHNAQVLRIGHDDKYDGVPALVGATSGVHLALLLAFEQLARTDTAALFALSEVAGAAYVLGLFYMCVNTGCSRFEAALIALGGLILGGALFQLLNGMDTGLGMAAVAWNVKLLTDRKRTLWLPVLCGIMPFIRPELSFLAVGSMLILFWERDSSTNFKVAAAATAVLSSAPFLLWYWIDTGSIVPSTISAKMYYFAERYADWSEKSRFVLLAMIRAIVASFPIVLCLRFMRPRAVGLMLALFMVVFLGSYFWRFPGGLVHNGGRYLFVFAPIVLYGVACGLSSTFRKQTLRLVAISGLFLPLGFVAQFSDYETHIAGYRESLADLVNWMNHNLRDKPMVMVHDAGYVAYAGHGRLVDLVGLKTPAAMEFHKKQTYVSAGRLRSNAIAKIAEAFKPQYLVALQDWNDKFGLVAGLRDQGWSVHEIYAGRAPPETPVADIYHLYELRPPTGSASAPGRGHRGQS